MQQGARGCQAVADGLAEAALGAFRMLQANVRSAQLLIQVLHSMLVEMWQLLHPHSCPPLSVLLSPLLSWCCCAHAVYRMTDMDKVPANGLPMPMSDTC